MNARSVDLDETLDRCLALLEEGKTLEECLSRFPQHAAELRPLLETAAEIRQVPKPSPSLEAAAAGKQRMLEALAEKKRAQQGLDARLQTWLDDLLGLGEPARPRGAAQWALRSAVAVAAAFALIVSGVLLARSWMSTTIRQEAVLRTAEGAVDILPSEGEIWQPVSGETRVERGDRIRTGSLASAELVFFDGSVTELGPEVELTIARMSSRRDGSDKVIVLHQWLGQTHNQVQSMVDTKSRFKIETASAVATVHGTSFSLSVEADGTTRVRVSEGVVEVQAQDESVAVREGEETSVQSKQPPEPVRPAASTSPTATPEPPGLTKTPQAPGLTRTPQAPGLSKTPQAPGRTRTPQPPGQSKTPQAPGRTRTPQPPGQSKTPQAPGLTRTPQPPGLTKTPQPPGLTKTPQPPGQAKTPPGQENTPGPPDDGGPPGGGGDDGGGPPGGGGDDGDGDDGGGGGGPPGGEPPGKGK